MSNLRRHLSLLRYVPALLLAVPLILVLLFRQSIGGVEPDYDLNECLDDPFCYPYSGLDPAVPTPVGVFTFDNSCANVEEENCVPLGGECEGSGSCDRSGSASCIDGVCNATAMNQQVIDSGGALSQFSNWFPATDGTAWEVRFHRSFLQCPGWVSACFNLRV